MPLPRPGRLATAVGAGLLVASVLRRARRRPSPAPAVPANLTAPGPGLAPTPVGAPPPAEKVDPGVGPAPSTPPADPPERPALDAGFRADIEGLRGIAILLVLAFHSGLAVPGGFIGVDVFFVISGFLITGMLLREIERTGTISLRAFFGRRVRRLLPAAVVVLVATLPIAFLVVAPLDRIEAMTDGAAAIASLANVRFAVVGGDYFTAVTGPSPFLHFWSLSVEEQFYLFWPLLLLLVAAGRRPRLVAGIVLAAILAASLAASVLATETSATWAFYSLPCRAWQFAAGGLLTVVAPLVGRLPGPLLSGAGWVAVGALAGASVLLDSGVPYPGVVAAIPTTAAVALIASGERRLGPGLLLERAPIRFLGRTSYSLYLWHWPILVLPAIAVGEALAPTVVVPLLGVAIVVGWLSWAHVERRFYRPSPGPRPARWRPLAAAGVTIALVAALAGGLGAVAASELGPIDVADTQDAAAAGDLGPVALADTGSIRAGAPEDPPGPSTAPEHPGTSDRPTAPPLPSRIGEAPAATPEPTAAASPPPSSAPSPDWTLDIPEVEPRDEDALPKNVEPSLRAARSDIERLFADGCITQASGVRPASCVYGARDGSPTIALVGDSHASHWFPAFNVLANRYGWRLLPFVKVSCPFVDMPVYNLLLERAYPECATWRGRVIDELNEIQPDLVVVASGYRAIIAARDRDSTPARQGAAMARAVAALRSPVAILIDTPRAEYDIPGCLSRHRSDVGACAIPRSQAFPAQYGVREVMAAQQTGAHLLDLVGAVCPSTPCPVVRDGMILYRDRHHLTATFARSLADELDAVLSPLLRPPESVDLGPRS
jgi:peptidoglycan/LPS O-acetylase OafA/YrhL